MIYEIHPLADVMPAMSESEYQDLLADIKANGLLEPITLYENKILDGRHRLRASVLS
jgi:ParB-like chromosome segregation protein Spo0J